MDSAAERSTIEPSAVETSIIEGSGVEGSGVEGSGVEGLEQRARPWVESLRTHPVYAAVNDDRSVQRFMEWHVFCVWDFMSLLTALRQKLTGSSVPWRPTRDAAARRLINEIALDEESDATPVGPLSHFELYLEAMRACEADTGPIERLLERLDRVDWPEALTPPELPEPVVHFVRGTLELATRGSLPEIAAVFTYAREQIIPEMFEALTRELATDAPERWSLFLYYLERHIEVDRHEHGAAARELVARTCGEEADAWARSTRAVERALRSRLELWDAIQERIETSAARHA